MVFICFLTFLLTHTNSNLLICHLGASSDMETATKIATAMVISYGMSEKVYKLMFLHFDIILLPPPGGRRLIMVKFLGS